MLLLDPLARPIIAHRGDRAHAPENTMPAFEAAERAGAEAFELDVRVSADGHVVVFHDETVDRTTDGADPIESMPLAEIRELDAGARWSPDDDPERANGVGWRKATPFARRGIRVPLLKDVLEAFPTMPMIVDAKTVAAGAALVPMLDQFGARERIVVGSFLSAALAPARAAGYHTAASQRELAWLFVPAVLRMRPRRRAYHMIAMPPTYMGMSLPLDAYVRSSGVSVHLWTVNSPTVARRHWRRGGAGVITDDPAALKIVRDRAP